jgi:hypothetical protein
MNLASLEACEDGLVSSFLYAAGEDARRWPSVLNLDLLGAVVYQLRLTFDPRSSSDLQAIYEWDMRRPPRSLRNNNAPIPLLHAVALAGDVKAVRTLLLAEAAETGKKGFFAAAEASLSSFFLLRRSSPGSLQDGLQQQQYGASGSLSTGGVTAEQQLPRPPEAFLRPRERRRLLLGHSEYDDPEMTAGTECCLPSTVCPQLTTLRRLQHTMRK